MSTTILLTMSVTLVLTIKSEIQQMSHFVKFKPTAHITSTLILQKTYVTLVLIITLEILWNILYAQ